MQNEQQPASAQPAPRNKYTAAYFLRFFKSKPASKWTTGTYRRQRGRGFCYCALGFADGYKSGQRQGSERGSALRDLFMAELKTSPAKVNDNFGFTAEKLGIKGKHPRTRILNALRLIQRKQEAAK